MTMEGSHIVERWLGMLPDLRVAAVSLLVLTIVARFSWIKRVLSGSKDRKDVPEPPALPIIGHLHLVSKLPHQAFMKLSAQCGPIMSVRIGSMRVIVASNAPVAREFLKTQDAIWASRPPSPYAEIYFYNTSNGILQPLNDVWRKMRKAYFSGLMSTSNVERQKVQRHESTMHMVNTLLESQKGSDLVDIFVSVANMNFYHLAKVVFGKNFNIDYKAATSTPGVKKTLPQLVRELANHDLLTLGECFPSLKWMDLGGTYKKLKEASGEFDDYVSGLLEERRRRLQAGKVDDDTMDFAYSLLTLLDKEDGTGLTYENVKSALMDVFLGGIETTAGVVTATIAEIMRNPDVKEKLLKELDDVVGRERLVEEFDLPNMPYFQLMFKESLRLHPPVPLMVYHYSLADSVVAGYHIPANTILLVNTYAIHRDPEYWKDPLAFKPERFADGSVDFRGQHFQYLPFGSGRRQCPGMNMGLINSQMIIARVFQTLNVHLPPGMKPEDVDMREKNGTACALANPLKVAVSPRVPLHLYRI